MASGRHWAQIRAQSAVTGTVSAGQGRRGEERGGVEENKGELFRHTGISSGVELIKARPVGDTHSHMHTRVYTDIHTHNTQTHTHTRTHTHTHTHTHTLTHS